MTVSEIATEVSQFYGVPVEWICSSRRSKSAVIARRVCIYLARQYTILSYCEITELLKCNRMNGKDIYSTAQEQVDNLRTIRSLLDEKQMPHLRETDTGDADVLLPEV